MPDIAKKISNGVIVIFLLCFISSCNRLPQEVVYEEIFEDVDEAKYVHNHDHGYSAAKEPGGTDDPHAGLTKMDLSGFPMDSGDFQSLVWTTPQGWDEEESKGMRLVTFTTSPQSGGAIECSVVSMKGGAGGLTPNVVRWAKQIGIIFLSSQELSTFIEEQKKFSTGRGWRATIFDFTQLQKELPSTGKSLIVAVIEMEYSKVFIKMTGSRESLINNTKQFNELVRSIRPESS